MKKSTILIAVLAVISAASAAKAEVFNMDFDGKLKPQPMHDIFSNSHQFIPAPKLSYVETPSELSDYPHGFACPNEQLAFACSPSEHFSGLTCKCEPGSFWQDDITPIDWNSIYQYIQTGNDNYCAPVASGPRWVGCVVSATPTRLTIAPEIPRRSFSEMSTSQQRAIAIQYMLQAGLKKAVIAGSAAYKFTPETVRFISDGKTKILYDNKKVYITNGKALLVISDKLLMIRTQELHSAVLHHLGNTKDFGATIIGGAGVIIGCMASDNCSNAVDNAWGSVGDAVSDISEAITNSYYTNGPGAGQQQGWDDMPD